MPQRLFYWNSVFIFLFKCEMSLNSAGQQGSVISTETISQNIDNDYFSFFDKGWFSSSHISNFISNSAFTVRRVDC